MSLLFISGGQRIGALASAAVFPMNIQGWFPLGLTSLISLQFKGLSRVFSSTTIWKHQFFSTQPSLWSESHIHTWLLEKPQLWLYRSLSAKWCLCFLMCCLGLSLAQLVKNPSAMQETPVWFLGQEDLLEKGKATHSSILAWRIAWTIQSTGLQRVGHNWVTFTFMQLAVLNLGLSNESSKS